MTVSRTAHPSPGAAGGGRELADALISLGHDCPLGCGRAAAELGAPVLLTRTGLPLPLQEQPTLVIVDSGGSGAPLGRSHQLVRFLDRCARSDGIRVRDRRASDVAVERPALRAVGTSAGFAVSSPRLLEP
jgi:hypothetical protein